MAVEEPRIGAVASFSPCLSMLRGELPKRRDLRILLAHGSADAVCSVEESRSLARVLEAAHKPAQYIEFDGPHTVPPEAVHALVALATAM
jgi:predicted esterase